MKSYLGKFYRHLAIFSGHTACYSVNRNFSETCIHWSLNTFCGENRYLCSHNPSLLKRIKIYALITSRFKAPESHLILFAFNLQPLIGYLNFDTHSFLEVTYFKKWNLVTKAWWMDQPWSHKANVQHKFMLHWFKLKKNLNSQSECCKFGPWLSFTLGLW